MKKFLSFVVGFGVLFELSGSITVLDNDFADDAKEVSVFIRVADDLPKGLSRSQSREKARRLLDRISRMPQLKRVSIQYYVDNDADTHFPIEVFAGLTNLSELALSGSVERPILISSLSSMKDMPVKELDLKHVRIKEEGSFSCLKQLKRLTTDAPWMLGKVPVDLEGLSIESVAVGSFVDLSRFTKLRSLELHDFSCEGVLGVGKMSDLQSLWLCGSFDFNFDDLKGCRKLSSVSLHGGYNWIGPRDFWALSRFPLEYLDINSVPIQEIRGLEKCPLKDVVIHDCPVRDLESICDLPYVERLDVRGTCIRTTDKDMLKRRFPRLKIYECIANSGDAITYYW